MSNFVWFILFVLFYWLLAFVFLTLIQKPFFYFVNRNSAPDESGVVRQIFDIERNGAISDAIIASYVSAVPVLIACVGIIGLLEPARIVMMIYDVALAIALSLIVVADACLYGFWRSKIDASVFPYLRSLKGATASVTKIFIAKWVLLWFVLSLVVFSLIHEVSMLAFRRFGTYSCWGELLLCIVAAILLLAILFVIIRGLKIRPNNPSVVYFSKHQFLNHCALNPVYSMIYSLSTKDEFKGKFRVMPEDKSRKIVNDIFPTSGKPLQMILNTRRPNILLVIWESLSADFLQTLGGRKSITPNLDRLALEGVIFKNCVSGSFRTDRALVCILSGYLGQPTTSVIRYTKKLPNLPALPRLLKTYGYDTTAVHGGELTIMHKSDYYLASGHDRLVSRIDFPSGVASCKWGVHDGVVFDRIFGDIMDATKAGKQWFTTFQTLSSHEPFTVPFNAFPDDKVANSFAYTDDCFGRFIDKLKKTEAWNNTLVICVADHGLNIGNKKCGRREYAHIPLLMLGGAVCGRKEIDVLMSQTDLAATLLGQMGIDHSQFIFSRDVLADTYISPSAFHAYNNGFLYVDTEGYTDYDNISRRAIEGDDINRITRGQAILQELYKDLSNR